MILRVFVSDIVVKGREHRFDSYLIVGRLQSGMEVIIEDNYHDLRKCIGRHIDMLLSFMRSHYCELQRGLDNQIFLQEKFYSVELVEELVKKEGVVSAGNKRVTELTGEYIDSYIVPEKWAPLTQRKPFGILYKQPSALKTEDGTFLLYPIHSQRRIPIEQIPREVTIAGGLSLEAWTSTQ